MVFGTIDISHYGTDGLFRILHQLGPVAADGVEAVDRFSHLKQVRVGFRQIHL